MEARAEVPQRPNTLKIALAFTACCLMWGSVYVAFRYVVKTMPPFTASGLRGIVAGVLLALVVGLAKGFRTLFSVDRRQLVVLAVVGALLWSGGLISAGEKTVPAGIAALLIATIPFFTLIMRSVFREKVPPVTYLAVVVGLIGIGVLFLPGKQTGTTTVGGVALIMVSVIAWCVGTILIPRTRMPLNPLVATCYMVFFGGLFWLILGVLIGEDLDIGVVSTQSWLAQTWIILTASSTAYVLFVWLVKHATVSLANSTAYMEPMVAVVLAALILHEAITVLTVIGGSLVLASVAVVVLVESRMMRRKAAEAEPEAAGDEQQSQVAQRE
jgi:drug/metabolite transporter (DMT)-like permease